MNSIPLSAQLINLFASVILLLAFAMLAQRRVLQLINLFAWQGFVLFLATLVVAVKTGQSHLYGSAALTLTLKAFLLPWILHRLVRKLHIKAEVEPLVNLFALQGLTLCLATLVAAVTTSQVHLYYSAGLTFMLKVLLLPWILHRLVRKLNVKSEVEALINIPTTMLVGIVLVMVAFNVALPISELSHTITRGTLGIALAVVMLAFLMMITRQKAITQVVGFLSMENGLFLAATSATYGMPMVVELGIALDVLVGVIILGVFFFQIRDQFDSLDIRNMEQLKDN